ncbi:unnamed protein product [Orchesella dallaii]|uniref:RING-type E3 ubiquitin transferase n=1 Tax=Orchesella dallaii TaxID=48710 RepID=A0ABP1RIJ8_9HEXA
MSSNSKTKVLSAAEIEEIDERFLDLIKYEKELNRGGDDTESEFSTISKTTTNPPEDEERDEEEEEELVGQSDQFEEEEVERGVQDREEKQEGEVQVDDDVKANDEENYEEEEDDDEDNILLPGSTPLLHVPTEDILEFDITCGMCWKCSGPPQNYCTEGHTICTRCYDQLEIKTCRTQMKYVDDDEEEDLIDCGSQVIELPDSVKNSEHYKHFLEMSTFTCGAWSLGCDKLELKYDEIEKHELEECLFRPLRYCQFRSVGCGKSFDRFEDHLRHLIEEHELPVSEVMGGGHFLVPYDRKAYEESMEAEHHGIIPIIRGVVLLDSNIMCLLMAKEVVVDDQDMTRIWVCYVGPLRKEEYLEATICVLSSSQDDQLGHFATEIHVRVLQAINTAPDVDSSVAFTDVSNAFLDKEMVFNVVGQKCMNMMICIMKIRKEGKNEEEEVEGQGQGETETGEGGDDVGEDDGEGQLETGEETEGDEHQDLWQFVV